VRTFARFRVAILLALALAGASPAASQQLASGLYRLDAGSTHQAGCFDPCLCPIQIEVPVLGTLALAFQGSDGLFDVYAVSDVNWEVPFGGDVMRVLGSGSYRIGGEFALEHQLELDLAIDDGPLQHFDSGRRIVAESKSAIDVAISLHGMVCNDIVFVVRASPVPRAEIRPYRLDGRSTFQRGCVGLCDCLTGAPLPIRGSFGLVDVGQSDASSELVSRFAVVDVRWKVDLDGAGPNDPVPVRGLGPYEVGGEFALQQQLALDLEIGAEPAARFDSGLVPGGAGFPGIDVRVSNGDPDCFETAIDVHAKPRSRRATRRR